MVVHAPLFAGACGDAAGAVPMRATSSSSGSSTRNSKRRPLEALRMRTGEAPCRGARFLESDGPAAARPGEATRGVDRSFNPEMALEWQVMHGAKLVANWDPARGRPTWYALVPRDDGTIAAAVTAGRLSDGVADTPLNVDGNQIAVEKLGRPGALLAVRAGETLIFGSTRDELLRAMRSLPSGHTALPTATGRADPQEAAPAGPGAPFESGAIFVLDPTRLATEPTLPLPAGSLESCFAGSPARAARETGPRGRLPRPRFLDARAT